MRGSSNNHKSKSEEEGVALVQVAEEGETTTKQQQQPDSNKAAAEEEEEEAGYGYSNWWSTWVSSAVKKRVRAPGRVGIVVVVGGFVLLALLAAVATTTTTTWPQLVDFTGAVVSQVPRSIIISFFNISIRSCMHIPYIIHSFNSDAIDPLVFFLPLAASDDARTTHDHRPRSYIYLLVDELKLVYTKL